jgi:hypothetical protein
VMCAHTRLYIEQTHIEIRIAGALELRPGAAKILSLGPFLTGLVDQKCILELKDELIEKRKGCI